MVRRNGANGMEYVLTPCRMPPDMHAKLVESANEAGRSLNAELLFRLGQTLGGDFAFHQEEGQSLLAGMTADIKAIRELAESFIKARVPGYR